MTSKACIIFSVAMIGLAGPVAASDQINATAKSMLQDIYDKAPLLARRSSDRPRIAPASTRESALSMRLSRAPGLAVFEDEYTRCVVSRSLLYATATSEPANTVAEASTALCSSERDVLVTGYRLALWGVMEASVSRVDDPVFIRAANARVERIEQSVARVLSARIVHMRAMANLNGQARPRPSPSTSITQIADEPTAGDAQYGFDKRIRRIADALAVAQ